MALTPQEKAEFFCRDTIETLQRNFKTQGIFPYPVITNDAKANARAQRYSTGAAFDSFYHNIRVATKDTVTLEFFYNYYLNFVDLGVGKGRNANQVKRSANSYYKARYTTNWNPKSGETHRPGVAAEFRHLRRRMQRYYMNEYDNYGRITILNALGLEIDDDGNVI